MPATGQIKLTPGDSQRDFQVDLGVLQWLKDE
jgi:hypothetical protein